MDAQFTICSRLSLVHRIFYHKIEDKHSYFSKTSDYFLIDSFMELKIDLHFYHCISYTF
jgi:hypothetical protein